MEVDAGAEQRNTAAENNRGAKDEKEKAKEREGRFLLGWPSFVEMANGRLQCVETGHELPARERESYSRSKACRLALIDAALSSKKPPLNLFRPDPLSKSKLVCELTGDIVNKSEEHVWKHISGRRFQNKLEQREAEKLASAEKAEKDVKQEKKQQRMTVTVKKNWKEDVDAIPTQPGETVITQTSDSEEPEFWVPPVGDRWDFDDGKDRWESCMSSGHETADDVSAGGADQKDDSESRELAIRTKRMSISVGPSSFASRKKRIKRTPSSLPNEFLSVG